jgi:prevent-host-death family protein
MAETITARDASHQFARLLADVKRGREFVITRHGRPVARVIPERDASGERRLTAVQEDALRESLHALRVGWLLGIWRLDRDELYDTARLPLADP